MKTHFFSGKLFCRGVFLTTQTKTLPALPAVLWLRDGISFFPTTSLPGQCPSLAISGLLPHAEGRAFSKSKEDRSQVKSSPFPCFRKSDIQGQHLFSPGTILKLQNHHWQKAFLTCSLNFPFCSMSQLLLVIQSSALQPCGISFLLYSQNTCRYWCYPFNSFLWCIWKCIIYTEMTFQVMLWFDFVLQAL